MKRHIIILINCLLLFTFKTNSLVAADSLTTNDANKNKVYPDDPSIRKAPVAYKRSYQSVTPPFKNVEVEKNIYEIDGTAARKIKDRRSGTEIMIPKNAFVDAEGKPVQGKVTIDYREFRDVADFIVSGIPMNAINGDSLNFFQSGGMFEINASQNGKEVFLAPGKQIELNFVSTDTASYNFYSFNDKENKWETKGTANTIKSTAAVDPGSLPIAYRYYMSYVNSRIQAYDSTTFAERFDSCNYYYTTRSTDKNFGRISEKSKFLFKQNNFFARKNSGNQRATPNPIIEKDGTFYKMSNLVKVRNIKKTKDGQVLFALKTNYLTHPEMNVFSSCKWVTTDKIQMDDFRTKYTENIRFNDVRIHESGGNYIIKLKSDSGIYSINAIPVKLHEVKGKTIAQPFSPRYKEYNKTLANRERVFNKRMKKGRLKDNYYYPKNGSEEKNRTAWVLTRPKMNTEEQQMSYEEWQKSYNEMIENERKAANTSAASGEGLMRSLALDGFGIFNCDQVQQIKEPVVVHAKYKNATKKDMPVACTYIIDEKINGVLRYTHEEGYKYNPSKIVFGKRSNNRMLITKDNGEVAIYTKEQFAKNKFSDRERFTFDVIEMNSKVNSVEDMRKILGL